MCIYARAIALLSLVLMVVLPALFLAGRLSLENVKMIMLVLTAVWFVSASIWIGRSNASNDKSNK